MTRDLRSWYDFVYPKCGHDQHAAPSMSMQAGFNSGHGTCLKCKAFLHLRIVPGLDDGDTMEAIPWDEHMKKMEMVKK